MQGWLMGGALAIATLLAGGVGVGAAKAPTWLTDYEQARAEARRTGKPILLIFR
jgi:hypothetical protein